MRAAALLAAPITAFAQPFVEVGVGTQTGGCMYDGYKYEPARIQEKKNPIYPNCSSGAIGVAAFGYKFGDTGLEARWDHFSALQAGDRGTDYLTIRYRYDFK